jgi:hypothetical protein
VPECWGCCIWALDGAGCCWPPVFLAGLRALFVCCVALWLGWLSVQFFPGSVHCLASATAAAGAAGTGWSYIC